MRRILRLLFVLTILSCVFVAFAGSRISNPHLTVDSTYLGEGWFQYDVTWNNDGFYAAETMPSVGVSFTNRLTYGTTPNDWTAELGSNTWNAVWAYTNLLAVQKPYTARFLARSSNTSYMTSTQGITVLGHLATYPNLVSSSNEALGVNIAYYTRMSVLVPCRPDQADDSPTTLRSYREIVPKVVIDDFVMASNRIHGLVFAWGWPCIVRVEACDDIAGTNWTHVTNIVTYEASTTWTSSVPLDVYGKFYRLLIVNVL